MLLAGLCLCELSSTGKPTKSFKPWVPALPQMTSCRPSCLTAPANSAGWPVSLRLGQPPAEDPAGVASLGLGPRAA